MRWLSNGVDPGDDSNARYFDETIEQAWTSYKAYTSDKLIASPKATEKYTVAELVTMGVVGIYAIDNGNGKE